MDQKHNASALLSLIKAQMREENVNSNGGILDKLKILPLYAMFKTLLPIKTLWMIKKCSPKIKNNSV